MLFHYAEILCKNGKKCSTVKMFFERSNGFKVSLTTTHKESLEEIFTGQYNIYSPMLCLNHTKH